MAQRKVQANVQTKNQTKNKGVNNTKNQVNKQTIAPVRAQATSNKARPGTQKGVQTPAKTSPKPISRAVTQSSAKSVAKTPVKAAPKTPLKAPAKTPAKAPLQSTKTVSKSVKAPAKVQTPTKVVAKSVAAKSPVKTKVQNKVQKVAGSVTPSSGYKGVSRIDNPRRNSYGWYVRVRYRGINYSKFFSDSVYGGTDQALNKAVRYRNKLEREIGKPRTDRTLIVMPTNNESGMIGVKKTMKGNSPVYDVTWSPEPNVIQRTTVSIRKHGEEEALRKARAIRLAKERKFYGSVVQKEVANAALNGR